MEDTLFSDLETLLPENRYQADILKDLILIECGDLYPYYQVPTYLKIQINNFFARYKEQFKRAWDALYSDYNPIENYDRLEAWSDSHSQSTSESLSTSSSESISAQTSSSDSTSSSSKGDVSAFNTSSYQPQSASAGNAQTAGTTRNDTRGAQNSVRDGKTQEMALDNHRGRVHGNIGTMTTQEMINSSLELANYDIYLWVVTLFRKNIISAIV